MAEPWGVAGQFRSAGDLVRAVAGLRGRGLVLEAYTPHPVHGLDAALGLRRSRLGLAVLAMALAGAGLGYLLQAWTTAVDYPLVTGGKPPSAWVPLVPVTFEVAILFASLTAGLGMLLGWNGLPRYGHPMLASQAQRAATRDRYVLVVTGPAGAGRAALAEAGAEAIEEVPWPVDPPRPWLLRTVGRVAAATAAASLLAVAAIKLYPELRPMRRMERQPRLGPQQPSGFFADGGGMRTPVPGTVARGHMPLGVAREEEADQLVNPLPRSPEVLADGRAGFLERCSVCHGALGDGRGTLTAAYGAAPANLHSDRVRTATDGHLFWVITRGRNAMPGHEAELPGPRRWAVVHYVRALQRARHAETADLPEGTP